MRTTLIAIAAAVLVSSSAAEAADRYVSTKGNDQGGGNPCTVSTQPCRTIAHALEQASSGDVIKVAKGTYKGSVDIDTGGTWTIRGGYRNDFSEATRNAAKNKTKVGGDEDDRFLLIHAGSGQTITVDLDGLVVQKSVGGDGGGILARADGGGSIDLGLDEMTFIGNKADQGGALALSTEAGSIAARITASRFKNNKAAVGGAIFAGSGKGIDLAIETTRFEGNQAEPTGGGGAIFIRATDDGVTATIRRSLFLKNKSGDGGAIALHARSNQSGTTSGRVELAMENSVLHGNSAGNGGAINAEALFSNNQPATPSVALDLRNNTFVGNKAVAKTAFSGFGGALYLLANPPSIPAGGSATVTGTLLNNIIRGNTAGQSPASGDVMLEERGGAAATASLTLTKNNVERLETSGGATAVVNDPVDDDPQLVKKQGVLRLKPESPMIDAGTCVGAPSDDIDGDPRPKGNGCDVGADEF